MSDLPQNEIEQDSLVKQLREATTKEDKLRIVDEWNKNIQDTHASSKKDGEIEELKKVVDEIREIINEGNGRLKSLLNMV